MTSRSATKDAASQDNISAPPEISIVITCWQMERELERTLWSLSRAFQKNVDDLSYEIIVVDNGSDWLPHAPRIEPAPQITRAHVTAPSPVGAMNQALGLARANLVGAWIDGARLASANLLAAVRRAALFHAAPVIAVPNRQFGPNRQAEMVGKGYDRAVEDALLAEAGWPDPGADLFAISWPEEPTSTAPMLESNALFLRRETWGELGGYDPAFNEPGGGLSNADMFERSILHPGTQLIRMSGVATFHQTHGGVSTGDAEQTIRMLKQASRRFTELRGRPPRKQREPGWVFDAATGVMDKGHADTADDVLRTT